MCTINRMRQGRVSIRDAQPKGNHPQYRMKTVTD
nr:MAG TPA: hypothetical protein [Caudoviricetes sp.]